MNFFRKKKYKEINDFSDFTKLEDVSRTLYIYTTGILDHFDKAKDKRIYMIWNDFLKKILEDLPNNVNIHIIHYCSIYYKFELDAELSNLNIENIKEYLLNSIETNIDLNRITIEFKLEDFNKEKIYNVNNTHIVYDFVNIIQKEKDKLFINDFTDSTNIVRTYVRNVNLVNLNIKELLDYDINFQNIKFFNMNKEYRIETYLERINLISQENINKIDDIINLFDDKWKEIKNQFWKVNKERLRLYNFGTVGNLPWKRIIIETIFNLIWIEDLSWNDIIHFTISNLESLINEL